MRRPWIEVQCRADGRPRGYTWPQPWSAAVVIPLHLDELDVPTAGAGLRVRVTGPDVELDLTLGALADD